MKKIQQGFTLIELMIVIAILGILMAIAIPAYGDYTVRAKVSEGINLAGALKMGISEYVQSEGKWPTDNATAGVSGSITGNDVGSVVNASGVITVTYKSSETKIDGKKVLLSAYTTGGAVKWTCGATGTDVDTRFLPSSCRG